MKNKSAKISTDQLFFSHTWNFLNVYLVKQVGRSQATAESYRDSLTIFKNYLVGELGKSISTFQFLIVPKNVFIISENICLQMAASHQL